MQYCFCDRLLYSLRKFYHMAPNALNGKCVHNPPSYVHNPQVRNRRVLSATRNHELPDYPMIRGQAPRRPMLSYFRSVTTSGA